MTPKFQPLVSLDTSPCQPRANAYDALNLQEVTL